MSGTTAQAAGGSKKPTLYSIQYLRAAAAAATVLHHTELTHTTIGESGVDLFFIISGFIMALVCRPTTQPLTFLTLRFWRIYPLWWLITLVTIAVRPVPPWSSVTSSLLLWPSVMPIVYQGWTLQIEVLFYALIAAGLWLAPRRVMVLVSGLLCVLAVAGLILMPDDRVAVTYTQTMLLEFVAGIVLHRLWSRGTVPGVLLSVVLVAVAVGAMAVQFPMPRPNDHWRVLYWGVPYALLLWAVLGLERAGKVPHSPVLRLLGDASYSLYLVHLLVIPLFKPWAWGFPAPVVMVMILFASEIVSVVLYLMVERPLIRSGHRIASLLDRAPRTVPT